VLGVRLFETEASEVFGRRALYALELAPRGNRELKVVIGIGFVPDGAGKKWPFGQQIWKCYRGPKQWMDSAERTRPY
jgi:hypothetical protein